MRIKHKWHSILLAGLVLLLAISFVACGPQTTAPSLQPPVIVRFDATPTEIKAGESAVLLWEVTRATTVTIDQGIGNVSSSGTKTVRPTVTSTYTLTATNTVGTVTKAVVIPVKGVPPPLPPVIDVFSVTPSEITAGESATLKWKVTGATTVNIDQGIGAVPSSGSISVKPSQTAAYTLTAINEAGSVTKSVVIRVDKTKDKDSHQVIPWEKAKDYIGQVKVVEGHVASATWASGSKGKPTFLNIGNPYPNPNRFTVVIWIDHRDKFVKAFPPNPESYFLSKTVRVRGLITSYKGVPQIELRDPSNIWVAK